MEDTGPALRGNGALCAPYVLGGQFHVSVLCVGHVIKAVVLSVRVNHHVLCVFLYVEKRDGGSWYKAAVAPEGVYPPVSWVGVYVPTLEDPLVVEGCVVGADDRSAGDRCVVVAGWYPCAGSGRGVEETGNIE